MESHSSSSEYSESTITTPTNVTHPPFQSLALDYAPQSQTLCNGNQIIREAADLQRVHIWDTANKKVIEGDDAPLELNIAEYLEKNPTHEVYDGHLRGISFGNEAHLGDTAVVAVEQAVAPQSLDQSPQRLAGNDADAEAAADSLLSPEPSIDELAASPRSLAMARYAELMSNTNGPKAGFNHSISSISQQISLGEENVFEVQKVLEACCEAVAYASDEHRQREAHASALYQRILDNGTGLERADVSRDRSLTGERVSELKAVAEARRTRAMAAAARATDSESPHSGSNGNGFGSSGSSYDDVDHEPQPLEREALAVGAPVLVAGRGGGVVIKLLANRWRRVRFDADGSEASFKQRDLLELNDGLGAPATFGSEAGLAAAAAARAAAREASGDFSDDDDGIGSTQRRTRARLAAMAVAAQAAAQLSMMETGLPRKDINGEDIRSASGVIDSCFIQDNLSQQLPSRWICCDVCNKWRRVPGHVPLPSDDEEWRCELNSWDLFNRCWVDEEPGALEPTDDEEEDGSSAPDEQSKGAGASAGHSTGLGRRRPADVVRGAELSAVLTAGAEAVWALPKGRLVCWVESRAYAVAHSGETIAQVARSFDVSLDDLLLINAAVDSRLELSDPRIAQEMRLAAGAMLLLPWLNQPSQRLWHELTAQLLTDGWRLEWQTIDAAAKSPSTSARRIAYFPPRPSPPPQQPLSSQVESSTAPSAMTAKVESAVSTPPPSEQQLKSSMPTPPPTTREFRDEVSTDAAALLALGDAPSQLNFSSSVAAATSTPKPFVSLDAILRAQPSLLNCFELATPERALTYLAKAQEKRAATSVGSSRSSHTRREWESSRGIVDVLSPVFEVGSWVLARTSADKPWSFAKVLRWRLRDGKYDLLFEDGLWAKGIDLLAVRPPNAQEQLEPRRIPPFGRVAYRADEATWTAYYRPPAIASPTATPVEIPLPSAFSSLADAEAALRAFARTRGDKRLDTHEMMLRGDWTDKYVEEEEYEEYEVMADYSRPGKGALRTSSRASSSTRVLSRTDNNRAASAAAEAADTEARAAVAASAAGLCPVCLEAVARAPTTDTVSSEEEEGVDDDAVLETVCCRRLFHRTCLESHVAHAAAAAEVAHVPSTEGSSVLTSATARAACPACRNATAFHRQLRAARRLARFGDQDTYGSFSGPSGLNAGGASAIASGATGWAWSPADLAELVGRRIWCSGHVCGVAVAVDRGGRLVLELSNGAIEKARINCLLAVAPMSEPPYRIKMPLPEGTVPAAEAWKAAVEQATLAADQAAIWGPSAIHPPTSSSSRQLDASESFKSSRSKSARRPVSSGSSGSSSGKTSRGFGPGYLAPGAEPGLREWACELCGFLNGQFARRCGACGQGSQAKSMVGRAVQTTSGPGRVAVSSGKGWVVVETASGGRYRMRLSTLWDYTVDTAAATAASTAAAATAATGTSKARVQENTSAGSANAAAAAQAAADVQALQEASAGLQTASGFALPLPAQRAGDPGMPKNWSFSLLKKRVQTSHGIGVVTDVIDKGWIGVRLESGKKIKTRPGNVTALEGDEVIVSFAKKTKATHATRPPLRLAGATGTRGGRRRRHSRISEEGSESSDEDDRFIDEDGEFHGGDEAIGGSHEESRPDDGESEEVEDQRYGAQGGLVEAAANSGAATKHRARKRQKRHGVVAARRTVDFDDPGSYNPLPDDDDDVMATEEDDDDVMYDDHGGVVGKEAHEAVNVLNRLGTYSNSQSIISAYPSEASVPPPASMFKIGTAVECQSFGTKWDSGVVEYEHDDGTVSVLLHGSGDVVSNLPRELVRRLGHK